MQKLIETSDPRYWVCIIGPIEGNKLPHNADFAPRMAACRAVSGVSDKYTSCYSGWCDEAEYLRIEKARHEIP